LTVFDPLGIWSIGISSYTENQYIPRSGSRSKETKPTPWVSIKAGVSLNAPYHRYDAQILHRCILRISWGASFELLQIQETIRNAALSGAVQQAQASTPFGCFVWCCASTFCSVRISYDASKLIPK
jgi:hypothetical protein